MTGYALQKKLPNQISPGRHHGFLRYLTFYLDIFDYLKEEISRANCGPSKVSRISQEKVSPTSHSSLSSENKTLHFGI